jgi:pimeloyl-ACP methyl ester carboxylesterase
MQQQVAESARRRVTLDAGDGRGGDGSVEVSYRVAGEGPPVVLLHGVGLDAADVSWRYALPMLADGTGSTRPTSPATARARNRTSATRPTTSAASSRRSSTNST